MKLAAAAEMGIVCGLKTVGEAISNVTVHSMSIFKYEDINKEIDELYKDAKAHDDGETLVAYLGEERVAHIERDFNEAMERAI